MTTPTPDDLNRQVAEYAKDKCMNLSRTDGFATGERGETWADVKACAKLPTPETPLADRVRSIGFAFDRADNRRDAVRKLADDVAQLEREKDEAQSTIIMQTGQILQLRESLSITLREREAARQAIAMADGTLLQIVAERDDWKAKAERTCVVKQSDFHGSFYDTQCGDDIELEHGDLAENGYRFCPFCGGRIVKEEK